MLIPFFTVCVYLTRHWRSSLFSPTEFQKDDSRSSELSIRYQKIIGRYSIGKFLDSHDQRFSDLSSFSAFTPTMA